MGSVKASGNEGGWRQGPIRMDQTQNKRKSKTRTDDGKPEQHAEPIDGQRGSRKASRRGVSAKVPGQLESLLAEPTKGSRLSEALSRLGDKMTDGPG